MGKHVFEVLMYMIRDMNASWSLDNLFPTHVIYLATNIEWRNEGSKMPSFLPDEVLHEHQLHVNIPGRQV